MSIKRQLEASVLLERLGAAIMVGEDALNAFDHDRRAERMRREDELAMKRLRELLRWMRRENINEGEPEMTLADSIAGLEAQLREAQTKLEGERRRNDMQAGALRESRGENGVLREQVERLSKEHGELVQLFRTVYGTSERLCKAEQSIAAHGPNGAQPPPVAPTTLRGKLSRLRAKAEAAA